MKFIAIGSYTTQGLAGFMKNPEEDRKAALARCGESRRNIG